MIEDKELGIKIAEDTDEKFWKEMQEKCTESVKTEKRNIKVNETLLELSKKELS